MQIQCYSFEELSNQQLYAILQLRQQVFIEEQQSIYTDIDGLDQLAMHWCVFDDQVLAAYLRARAVDGIAQYKIERVVNHAAYRGRGLANDLMRAVLERIAQLSPQHSVQLSAQLEVIPFYHRFGFKEQGEPYDDGGILHKDMFLNR